MTSRDVFLKPSRPREDRYSVLQDMAFQAVLPQEPPAEELPRERSARLRARADGLMIIAASLMRESSELIRAARIQLRDSKAIQSGVSRARQGETPGAPGLSELES